MDGHDSRVASAGSLGTWHTRPPPSFISLTVAYVGPSAGRRCVGTVREKERRGRVPSGANPYCVLRPAHPRSTAINLRGLASRGGSSEFRFTRCTQDRGISSEERVGSTCAAIMNIWIPFVTGSALAAISKRNSLVGDILACALHAAARISVIPLYGFLASHVCDGPPHHHVIFLRQIKKIAQKAVRFHFPPVTVCALHIFIVIS
uniref:Uncharacterized protein n=1 Tax=Oryza nivara TaxID=4536 RepID=A0A0E0GA37_ORYNI